MLSLCGTFPSGAVCGSPATPSQDHLILILDISMQKLCPDFTVYDVYRKGNGRLDPRELKDSGFQSGQVCVAALWQQFVGVGYCSPTWAAGGLHNHAMNLNRKPFSSLSVLGGLLYRKLHPQSVWRAPWGVNDNGWLDFPRLQTAWKVGHIDHRVVPALTVWERMWMAAPEEPAPHLSLPSSHHRVKGSMKWWWAPIKAQLRWWSSTWTWSTSILL